MNVKANIWFEKLHRYVYDNHYIQNTRHRRSRYQQFKLISIVKFYNFLCPYFEGWRFSLKINFLKEKKYVRYEPKKLYLMKYEYNKLNKNLKIKYLEYKLFK